MGVYQTSAIREALAEHDVITNVFIHYLSHDADLVAQDQPGYQVQEVIDGKLDVAAAWGPVCRLLQGDEACAADHPAGQSDGRCGADGIRHGAGGAHHRPRSAGEAGAGDCTISVTAIHAILTDFGVPLVKCDTCLISGDLPSHGPYKPAPLNPEPTGHEKQTVTIAMLNDWLAHGANVNAELSNAVLADDLVRVAYLLDKKHASIDAQDLQGETPLHHALIRRSEPMVKYPARPRRKRQR